MQVGGLLPFLITCVATFRSIMVLIRRDWLFHKENTLVFIKTEGAVANHESSTRFEQIVNLAMYMAYGRFSRFAYVDWWLHEHALTKGIIERFFVSNELCKVLDLTLSLHIVTYYTLAGGDIMLNGRKHVLVAYITRATQVSSSLSSIVFARLLMIFDLSHGIFKVNRLCNV